MIKQSAWLVDRRVQKKLGRFDFTIGFPRKMRADAKQKHQDSRTPRPSSWRFTDDKKIYERLKKKKKKSYHKAFQITYHQMVSFQHI